MRQTKAIKRHTCTNKKRRGIFKQKPKTFNHILLWPGNDVTYVSVNRTCRVRGALSLGAGGPGAGGGGGGGGGAPAPCVASNINQHRERKTKQEEDTHKVWANTHTSEQEAKRFKFITML